MAAGNLAFVMAQLCARFLMSNGHATCGAPMPGMYSHGLGDCGPFADPSAQDCCDACQQESGCAGIFTGDAWSGGSISPGNGDIINKDDPAAAHCVQGVEKTGTNVNSTTGHKSMSPLVSKCHSPQMGDKLMGATLTYGPGGGPNHLGQAEGRCPADPYHRVIGTTLNISDATSAQVVTSVGDCCDLCHTVPGCGGWTVKMPHVGIPENPAHWLCSLTAKDSKLARAFCHDCYSGVVTQGGAKVILV